MKKSPKPEAAFQSLRANFTFAREAACVTITITITITITMAELALLFEGALFTIHRRVREWKKDG